jgi:lipopolysaccharide transport system permease protein
MVLGAICARFRDVAPISTSIMQIAFFLTPVIWQPQQLGPGAMYLVFNPFFVLLQIVRAPLQGHMPTVTEWFGAALYSLLLCGISWFLFVRARGRIAFWI